MKISEMLEEIIREEIEAIDVTERVEAWIDSNKGYVREMTRDKLIPVFNEAIGAHLDYVIDNLLDELLDSPKIYGYALEAIESEVDE